MNAGGLSVPHHAPPEGDLGRVEGAGVTPPNFPTVMNMGMTHYGLACHVPAFGVAGGLYPIRDELGRLRLVRSVLLCLAPNWVILAASVPSGSRQRGYNYIKSAQMIRYKQGA